MKTNVSYLDAMRLATEKLSHGGVFLTVPGETVNTMTIGWGAVGYFWGKPVFIAVVRPQRHTYEMLREAGVFTVSVPVNHPLRTELAEAGVKSGRDIDKFATLNLTKLPGVKVDAPVVGECGLHFECKVLLEQDMTGDKMAPSIVDYAYRAGDYHTMFFGEILACYTTEE